jgi:hypothetical protein
MESASPRFRTPYIEPEQILTSLRVSDGRLWPFYSEAAILLLQGKSIRDTEWQLRAEGLEREEAEGCSVFKCELPAKDAFSQEKRHIT